MVRAKIVEDMEIAKVTYKNMRNIFSQSRSRIQLTYSRFKLIKFDNNKREQAKKPVGYNDVMANIANILIIQDNNCLLFKNNVE